MKFCKLLIILIFLSPVLFSQSGLIIFDEIKQQDILYGYCSKDDFSKDDFSKWFNNEYSNYQVDKVILNNDLSKYFDKVIVFLATWCGDTRRELPRFVKISETLSFKNVEVIYYALDGEKNTDDIDVSEFDINYVPTFIFYKEDVEIGRIVEQPKNSIENDILNF
jgi:thiol-disulfide isomerase/thioredoxin